MRWCDESCSLHHRPTLPLQAFVTSSFSSVVVRLGFGVFFRSRRRSSFFDIQICCCRVVGCWRSWVCLYSLSTSVLSVPRSDSWVRRRRRSGWLLFFGSSFPTFFSLLQSTWDLLAHNHILVLRNSQTLSWVQ